MKFSKGDRVRFLDEVGEATVIDVLPDGTVMIEDESGFDYPYDPGQLVLITNHGKEEAAYKSKDPGFKEIVTRNIDESKLKAAEDDFESHYQEKKQQPSKKGGDVLEVDLHIHELVDSDTGLDSHDKFDIQMAHFERMMRRAETQHIQRIIFIHGIGQGILRQEIRKSLKLYYPNANFFDADYREYGYGATEVRLRFN